MTPATGRPRGHRFFAGVFEGISAGHKNRGREEAEAGGLAPTPALKTSADVRDGVADLWLGVQQGRTQEGLPGRHPSLGAICYVCLLCTDIN